MDCGLPSSGATIIGLCSLDSNKHHAELKPLTRNNWYVLSSLLKQSFQLGTKMDTSQLCWLVGDLRKLYFVQDAEFFKVLWHLTLQLSPERKGEYTCSKRSSPRETNTLC
ncbi:hypothetical protein ILYODFUR_005697 [Ilyodon furcidens]|uniref:Uncharacterized protein n=1 Tax=Ilyodon furcidens TaxID=33524 RepID=A0ABV0TI48_9TELE